MLETDHQKGLAITAKVEDVELLFGGQGAVATAAYSVTYNAPEMQRQIQGNFLFMLERAGDGWKIHAASATRSRPSPLGRTRGLRRGRGVVALTEGASCSLLEAVRRSHTASD